MTRRDDPDTARICAAGRAEIVTIIMDRIRLSYSEEMDLYRPFLSPAMLKTRLAPARDLTNISHP
jgi:hypothetical protein